MVQRRSRPTIRDVAREAGVSLTTVSHALNGKGVVAPATRARVQQVSAELGYQPDAVATGLRNSKLGIIALVLRPLDSLETFMPEGVDYFTRFAGVASMSALEHGYGLMMVSDPTSPSAPPIALAADGFIIADPIANDPVIDLLLARGIPFLTVGRDPARDDYPNWIEADVESSTLLVLSHLADGGATNVALARGTDLNSWNVTTEQTYRAWCAERGQDPIVWEQEETSGEAGGAALADLLLASANRPDGVLCMTGRHAAGLAARLAEVGITAPDDILIVAGSDSEQSRRSAPPITALDLGPEAVARTAVAALMEQLGEAPVRRAEEDINGKMIVRASTVRTR
jgi:DNA-binding LacI/PurR family transcriptional regulator